MANPSPLGNEQSLALRARDWFLWLCLKLLLCRTCQSLAPNPKGNHKKPQDQNPEFRDDRKLIDNARHNLYLFIAHDHLPVNLLYPPRILYPTSCQIGIL